jgi:sugar phosphate isomerase/epimerase
MLSRRSFVAMAAAAASASSALAARKIPVGLELYSVRNELKSDLMGTVRQVAKLGYQDVEFFSPYAQWTPEYAKEVRKLLDDLGIQCRSTHNDSKSFLPENRAKILELNQILGVKYIVMASSGKVEGLDGWRLVADKLNSADAEWKPSGIHTGYHNHQLEFKPIGGKRPMDVLAENTTRDVMLQLDVGTCIEAGSDPVAWINANPGRIRSLHLKDWSPEAGKGYRVLFGEGVSPWKKIFQAAEKTGGVEFYLIEQEGADLPPIETAEKCLASFKALHGKAL